jgi:hypothetical protein
MEQSALTARQSDNESEC